MKGPLFASILVLAACGASATKDNPCPQGICTNGNGSSGGGGSGGSSSSGGGNSGGSSGGSSNGGSGSSSGGSTSSSGGSSGGCQPAWQCTPWQKQADGSYTRTCTDANNCGATSGEPATGPVALPNLDMAFYKCNVEPIFDRGCAFMNCHGTETGRALKVYARGRLRMDAMVPPPSSYSCPDNAATVPLKTGIGTDMCEGWFPHTDAEWQSNYDDARSFMVGLDASTVGQSDLLAQPVYGGKAHAGVHLFKSTDPDYQTIKSWLTGAKLASCDPGPN
jgi:hypothetical protein